MFNKELFATYFYLYFPAGADKYPLSEIPFRTISVSTVKVFDSDFKTTVWFSSDPILNKNLEIQK